MVYISATTQLGSETEAEAEFTGELGSKNRADWACVGLCDLVVPFQINTFVSRRVASPTRAR